MRIDAGQVSAYIYTGSRAFDPELPSVVFIHGGEHDHSVWSLQSRYFAHHGFNALAVDLPGHGKSGGAPLSSIEAQADWIVALLDTLAIARVALIGHSMGALIALEAAGRESARIARLALIGPAVPMTVSDALLDAAKNDEALALRLINGWSFSAAHQLGGNRQPGLWMMGNALRLMERARPGVLHVDFEACHRYATGLAQAARVRCPALLILGEHDLMAPPKNARALTDALSDARSLVIPGCGHSLMVEAPDAVLDALRAFIRQSDIVTGAKGGR